MLRPSMLPSAGRLLRCALALRLAVLLAAADQAGDEEGAEQEPAEAQTIKELKATLRSRGADCRACETAEDFTKRVAETQGWRADEAVAPDGKTRVTRQQFNALQRSGQREGHELDDGEDGEPDAGGGAWEEFRDAVRAGELVEDGQGGFRRRQVGVTGWRKYAKWALTLLGVCALTRRLLGIAPLAPQPAQPKGGAAAPRAAEGGGGSKKSTAGKRRK